jgi:hypothetical protein
MTCTYVLPPDDHACGRPIFAIWQRRDGLMTGLCETHDRIALRAIAEGRLTGADARAAAAVCVRLAKTEATRWYA